MIGYNYNDGLESLTATIRRSHWWRRTHSGWWWGKGSHILVDGGKESHILVGGGERVSHYSGWCWWRGKDLTFWLVVVVVVVVVGLTTLIC